MPELSWYSLVHHARGGKIVQFAADLSFNTSANRFAVVRPMTSHRLLCTPCLPPDVPVHLHQQYHGIVCVQNENDMMVITIMAFYDT